MSKPIYYKVTVKTSKYFGQEGLYVMNSCKATAYGPFYVDTVILKFKDGKSYHFAAHNVQRVKRSN